MSIKVRKHLIMLALFPVFTIGQLSAQVRNGIVEKDYLEV